MARTTSYFTRYFRARTLAIQMGSAARRYLDSFATFAIDVNSNADFQDAYVSELFRAAQVIDAEFIV